MVLQEPVWCICKNQLITIWATYLNTFGDEYKIQVWLTTSYWKIQIPAGCKTQAESNKLAILFKIYAMTFSISSPWIISIILTITDHIIHEAVCCSELCKIDQLPENINYKIILWTDDTYGNFGDIWLFF